MVLEKLQIAKEILEQNPEACSDNGGGIFLNDISLKLYPLGVDFTEFNVETYLRARRKVLELNPHLDLRTSKTKEVEEIFLDSSKELHNLKEQKKNAEQLRQEGRYALRVSFMEQKIQVQRSLKKVLNEDQYEQWKEHQLKRKKRMSR